MYTINQAVAYKAQTGRNPYQNYGGQRTEIKTYYSDKHRQMVMDCPKCGLQTTLLNDTHNVMCENCALAAREAERELYDRALGSIRGRAKPAVPRLLYQNQIKTYTLGGQVYQAVNPYGGAVKSAGDPYEFSGYAIYFSTNGDITDLASEWFDKKTDFMLDRYARKGAMSLLWEHGQSDEISGTEIATLKGIDIDDVGVFLRGALNRANRYADAIADTINAGKLGFSSGAIQHLVKRVKDKATGKTRITVWPWVETSLTATPCQPELTKVSGAM